MRIYLLTHQRELERKTNTGAVVTEVLKEDCQVFVWDRVSPDSELMEKLKSEAVALVYPCDHSISIVPSDNTIDSFIIIDATWQEAQKIYNHSPYLHDLPKVSLSPEKTSIYTLRRNQKETGLCTAECAEELLRIRGKLHQAQDIKTCLSDFILRIQKGR